MFVGGSKETSATTVAEREYNNSAIGDAEKTGCTELEDEVFIEDVSSTCGENILNRQANGDSEVSRACDNFASGKNDFTPKGLSVKADSCLWAAATCNSTESLNIELSGARMRDGMGWDDTTDNIEENERNTKVDSVDKALTPTVERDGIQNLLDLFDSPTASFQGLVASSVDADEESKEENDDARLNSQLSEDGECVVEKIVSFVVGDPARLQAVEEVCPRWKENVAYAQRRTDVVGIQKALSSVRKAMGKLRRTRTQLDRSCDNQQYVLELYQISLQEALNCLGEKHRRQNHHDVSCNENDATKTTCQK